MVTLMMVKKEGQNSEQPQTLNIIIVWIRAAFDMLSSDVPHVAICMVESRIDSMQGPESMDSRQPQSRVAWAGV